MRTLLKNAYTLDSAEQHQKLNILVEKDHILDIYTGDREVTANVIDMAGYYVMPGFINAHVHLFNYADAFNTDQLKTWLLAGFTTLRDEGIHTRHTSKDAVDFRDQCAKNPYLPSIKVCGQFLGAPKGYGGLAPIEVDSIPQARDAVKRQVDDGVDHIKVSLEDGYDLWTSELPKLSLPVLTAICSEAHRFGLKVSGHVTQLKNVRSILQTGVDDLSHLWTPSDTPDEIFEYMIHNDVILVPTLSNFGEFSCRYGYDAVLTYAMENLKAFADMGGTIAFGDNFIYELKPWFQIGMPVMEIELMHKAGLDFRQIIDSMTIGAAKALGIDGRYGKVEPGYASDLIATRGNPVDIPYLLSEVAFVMKDGLVIKHNEIRFYSMF